MAQYSGFFVALEGIDGSGKSTQAPSVVQRLISMGYDAMSTKEPSNGDVGKLCRIYLSDPHSIPQVDALLFAADRVEHYQTEILPALQEGKIVVTDRYKHSSIAYQGSAGVDPDWIKIINQYGKDPDLIVYLDLPVEDALARVGTADREVIEKFETRTHLQTIADIYEQLDQGSYKRVDARLAEDHITESIAKLIIKYLPNHSQ